LALLTRYVNPKTSVSWSFRIPRLAMLKHVAFLTDTA